MLGASNMLAFGTGRLDPLRVAYTEGPGGIWFYRKVLVAPRFEYRLQVVIDKTACGDSGSWALDGWALIISKSQNYLGGGGGGNGYDGIFDAIVTEIDLYKNDNDLSANSVSLNKCFGSVCSAWEGASTSQKNIPYQLDTCKGTTYDVRVQHLNGEFKVLIGDVEINSITANLNSFKDSWAYIGATGFFRGVRMQLWVQNSFICEDDYDISKFFKSFMVGSTLLNALTPTFTAGQTATLNLSFGDNTGLVVPHLSGLNIWNWSLSLGSSCGTANVRVDTTTNMKADITGCTLAGTQTLTITTDKGVAPAVTFTVLPSTFGRLVLCGYDAANANESTATRTDGSNNMFFNWGPYGGDFSIHDLSTGFNFDVCTQDIYGNPINLGTDLSVVLPQLNLSITTASKSIIPTLSLVGNGRYKVIVPIAYVGTYQIQSNKFVSDGKTRFSLSVYHGKILTTKSSCVITGYSTTPTLDSGVTLEYTCTLLDQFGNVVNVSVASKYFGLSFACDVTKDGSVTKYSVSQTTRSANFSCSVTTTANGKYSFTGSVVSGTTSTAIPAQLNSFVVIPTPKNIINALIYNNGANSFLPLTNSVVTVSLSLTSPTLTLIDFKDTDGTLFSLFGYPTTFNKSSIVGTFYTTHDTTSQVPARFDFVTFNSKPYIGVYIDSPNFIKRTSFQYTLDITFNSQPVSVLFNYPIGDTNGAVACSHPLSLPNTVFTHSTSTFAAFAGLTSQMGVLRLSTSDKNLWNYKYNIPSEMSVVMSPSNGTNGSLIAHPAADGFYYVNLSAKIIGAYTFSVIISGVTVVPPTPLTVITGFSVTKFIASNTNPVDTSKTSTSAIQYLATQTMDTINVFFMTCTDDYGNAFSSRMFSPYYLNTVTALLVNDSPVAVNMDNKSVNVVYDSVKRAYAIYDYVKQPGNYLLTITSTSSKNSMTFSYTKVPGAVFTATSIATVTSNKNLQVSQTAAVSVNLKDAYGFNIATVASMGTAATDGLNVYATAADATQVAIKFVDITNLAFRFTSDPIMIQSTYTLTVTYTRADTTVLTIPIVDNNFYVNYVQFDITKSSLSAVLSKTVQMSQNSILQVNNQVDKPLFNFLFYDSNNVQLQFVDKTSKLSATFTGAGLTINLNLQWIGTNQLMWAFPDDVNLANIVGGKYSLNVLYNGLSSQVYTLQFLGDGQDSDAGNGSPNFDNTFYSATDIRPVAGVNSNFNIEFRTAENQRVNNYGDITLFSFTNSLKLTTSVFKVSVQLGAKKGGYIITINSTVTSKSTNPIVLSISYNGSTLKQTVNVIVKCADLGSLTIDPSSVLSQPSNTLNNVLCINTQQVLFNAYDKYNNIYDDLYDTTLYTMDKIVKMFNLQHSNNAAVISSITTNPVAKQFTLNITSRGTGTINLSSSYMANAWTYSLLPGPLRATSTSGAFAANTNFVAGSKLLFNVFPKDMYNNVITNQYLSTADFNSIAITISQPRNVNKITDMTVSRNTLTNTVDFTFTLTESGTNSVEASVATTPITCGNCSVTITLAPYVFKNSIFTYNSVAMSTAVASATNVASGSFPTFALTLYDSYMNMYPFIPITFVLNLSFSGNLASVNLCSSNVDNSINVSVCSDSANRKIWEFLIGATGYSLALTNGSTSLTFPITITGGSSSSNASNAPLSVPNTFLSTQSVTSLAGTSVTFMIELRATDGLRKNFWYDIPNDRIKVSFSQAYNVYTSDVSIASLPGQYNVRVSSTKTFTNVDNNQISFTIDGIKFTKTVLYTVTPNVPTVGYFIDSKGVNYTPSNLPQGNADKVYVLKAILYDTYGNVADVTATTFNYAIVPPNGKSIVNSIVKNNDKSFTITVTSIYAGVYTFTSSLFVSSYSFTVLPGAPVAENSLARVAAAATAGDTVIMYIIPFDANNNYIDPSVKGLITNPFTVSYYYKDPNGQAVPNIALTTNAASSYPNNDISVAGVTTVSAFAYSVQLLYRNVNNFDVTLGTASIKCVNCLTNVSPGSLSFKDFNFQRYDSVSGSFVSLTSMANEDNAKTDIIYRVYPRDAYKNSVDMISDVTNYGLSTVDSKSVTYTLKRNNAPGVNSASYVEFVKNDDPSVNKDLTYNTLTGGTYTAVFTDKISTPVNKSIVLIGRAGDGQASNQEINVQNTVINESKLNFIAGQTGYLIIELRTVDNMRKNNWNQNVTLSYQILDVKGVALTGSPGQDQSFSSTIRNAGVLGDFYATVSSTLSTTALGTKKLVLQIIVNGIVVQGLSPLVQVTPGTMSKAQIMPQYLNPGTISLLEGSADTPRTFKVAAYDSFNNPAPCDPIVLKLSVMGPDNNGALITAGRDAVTGFASYIIENRLKGTYTVSSDSSLLPTYTFLNKNGALFIQNSNINLVDVTLLAGDVATLKITPKDKHNNLIAPGDVLQSFTATIQTPSGKILNADISSDNLNVILSTTLTEKGLNSWTLRVNTAAFPFTNSVTTVNPNVPFASNIVFILDGSTSSILNGGSLTRNINTPLLGTVILYDTYNNLIDAIPSNVSMPTATISGNNMTPINLAIAPSSTNNQFVISTNANDVSNFNHLVSGTYKFSFVFSVSTTSVTTTPFNYNLTLVSSMDDSGYGNGIYSLTQTTLSNTAISLPAGSTVTTNMRLKTALGLFYNNDINLSSDVKYTLTPSDPTFTFKIYKAGLAYSNYNVDVLTNTATSNGTPLILSISIKDPQNPTTFVPLGTNIIITVKPALPSKAIVVTQPPTTTPSSSQVTITFKLSDMFNNIFTKNSDVINNLVFTNNKVAISNAAVLLKTDGVTYSMSYLPTYPPRGLSLEIHYKDSSVQTALLSSPITTYIISEPYFPNSVVAGSNMNEMAAGSKLNLSVQLFDKNSVCVENIDNIAAYATVNGPLEKLDNSAINYNYKFTVYKNLKSTDGCGSSLLLNVPDNLVYNAIGSYKINVYLGDNSFLASTFTQRVVPASLDVTKFVAKYTMQGNFNPGMIQAGNTFTFAIQGNDRFMNMVTTSILTGLSILVKTKSGRVAVSSNSNSGSDYTLLFQENTQGTISASLKFSTADSYILQYSYNGNVLTTIDISQGPLLVTINPGACSANNPEVNVDNLNNVATSDPTYFDVRCHDSFNNTITVGGENMVSMITVFVPETKILSPVKSNLVDNKDGTYRVSFAPPLAGQYSIILNLNGVIYFTKQLVISDNSCPADTPNRCSNDATKCVANVLDCIPNRSNCLNNATPFYCPVGGINTCVASQSACDCPAGMIKCTSTNTCVPSAKSYLCSFSLPVSCAKLFPKAPIRCPDGICRANLSDTPAQRVCPIGFQLCPDLTCRSDFSKCAAYPDCLKKNMIRCTDMSCVLDQKDCPSLVTCPTPGMYVCPDGSCVTSETKCKPLPQCVAPNKILCSNNSCVSDISNCPRQIACGQGYALCSDVICKTTCLASSN